MASQKSTSSRSDSAMSFLEYIPIEGVERFDGYCPGGYLSMVIGERLGQYRVVHKLGYGSYSITWLCRDNQSHKYVAIKIGTGESSPRETEVLEALNYTHRPLLDHPDRALIPLVRNKFVIKSPNGIHHCYVMTPAMCSVADAHEASYKRLFQVGTARSIIAQLVLAVEYIHDRGIVHGDLHLGNILLRLPADFNQLSIDQLYEKHGLPKSEPVVRFDGRPLGPHVPSHAIFPVWLGKSAEYLSPSEVRVLLADFGEAYSPSTEHRSHSRTPISFAPPEARFEPDRGLSFSSDIWTLACIIWAILGQRVPFEDILATPDDITADQVGAIGKLPAQWWDGWDAQCKYFDEKGKPRKEHHRWSWEERFEIDIQRPQQKAGFSEFDAAEKTAVLDMLRSMLVFQPQKRLTIQEILKCEWMEKWALPELEKCDFATTMSTGDRGSRRFL